jgi:hypothetical protein
VERERDGDTFLIVSGTSNLYGLDSVQFVEKQDTNGATKTRRRPPMMVMKAND